MYHWVISIISIVPIFAVLYVMNSYESRRERWMVLTYPVALRNCQRQYGGDYSKDRKTHVDYETLG